MESISNRESARWAIIFSVPCFSLAPCAHCSPRLDDIVGRESYGYGDLDCLECDYVVELRASCAARYTGPHMKCQRGREIVSGSELFALKF